MLKKKRAGHNTKKLQAVRMLEKDLVKGEPVWFGRSFPSGSRAMVVEQETLLQKINQTKLYNFIECKLANIC